ncbi:MAG: hypothetical protein GYB21_06770 [Oceanospirillales bacterium]|nr:hypothetical protein [Oceanospirillales bacterium]
MPGALLSNIKSMLRAKARGESSRRKRLIHSLMADPGIQALIHQRATERGETLLQVEAQALTYLNTLCADMSPRVVENLYPLFSLLLRHLYPRIETRGLSQLHALSKTHQLIYLPNHRSHIDYLLISWALYRDRLSLPQVAAGDNLNLPLVGPLLRRGGAVFMRRSFLHDVLYTQLFQRYLSQLLQDSQAFEFFVEGGRSRTGRLLPARRGLLGMTLQAWQDTGSKPLALVPISINYDLCLENSQYMRELAGAPKKQESLAGVIASASNLFRRCGGAYMTIGEPLRLSAGDDISADAAGMSTLRRINAASVSTPMARLASLMPSRPDTPISRNEMAYRLTSLSSLLEQLGVPIPQTDPEPDRIITEAKRRGQISLSGDKLLLTDRQVAGLCFYRNGLTHALILPGLMLLLAARLPAPSKSTVTRLLHALRPYMDAEFHLPEYLLEDSVAGFLRKALLQANLLKVQDPYLRVAEHPLANTLIQLAEQVLLRQYLLIKVLEQQSVIDESQLLELTSRLSGHIHQWYGHPSPDYGDKRQLAPLLEQLERQQLLERKDGIVRCQRDLTPIIRIGQRLLPAVLLKEAQRWLRQH